MTARALLNTQWERKQRQGNLAAGDAKKDSVELAVGFISEVHSLARGLSSGPVAVQLCPPGEGGSEVPPAIGR